MTSATTAVRVAPPTALLALGVLAALAGGTPLLASGPVPSAPVLTARLQPHEITVGDRVHVELDVALPPLAQAGPPALPENFRQWGGAEVLAVSKPQRLPSDAEAPVYRIALVLTAFQPGEVSLPPVQLDFTAEAPRRDGRVPVSAAPQPPAANSPLQGPLHVQTPEGLGFTVRSVLPAEGQPTPAPPTAPQPLPVGMAFWWTAGALGLLAAALAGALVLGRRKLLPVAATTPALPPLARLLRELDAVAGEGSAERLHTELSLALRHFLGGLLGFPAAEQTTSEIDHCLRGKPLQTPTRRRLVDLLRRCDEVKFAKLPATVEDGRQRVELARGLATEVDGEVAVALVPVADGVAGPPPPGAGPAGPRAESAA